MELYGTEEEDISSFDAHAELLIYTFSVGIALHMAFDNNEKNIECHGLSPENYLLNYLNCLLLYLLSHSHPFIHKFINVTSELLYVLVG